MDAILYKVSRVIEHQIKYCIISFLSRLKYNAKIIKYKDKILWQYLLMYFIIARYW